jgi:hypothetical protein
MPCLGQGRQPPRERRRRDVVIGDGALGECGETVFVAGQCAFNGSANSVTCKE